MPDSNKTLGFVCQGRLRVSKVEKKAAQRGDTPELFTDTATLATGRRVVAIRQDGSSASPFSLPTPQESLRNFFHNKQKYRFGHSRGGEAAPSLISAFFTLDPQVRPSAMPLDRTRVEVSETVVGPCPGTGPEMGRDRDGAGFRVERGTFV